MESQCSACSQIGKIKCFCKDPEQIFCLGCLEKHILIGTRHIIKEISERKDPQCTLCKQQMEMICLCQDAKTRLCHNCLITHLATNPNITHSIEPSIADSLTDDPQDMQKYLERKKIIDYLVVEASSNFSVLEKYKEKVYKAKELILECLEKTVEEAIKKADQIKEDVEKIISYLEGKKFTQNSNDD